MNEEENQQNMRETLRFWFGLWVLICWPAAIFLGAVLALWQIFWFTLIGSLLLFLVANLWILALFWVVIG